MVIWWLAKKLGVNSFELESSVDNNVTIHWEANRITYMRVVQLSTYNSNDLRKSNNNHLTMTKFDFVYAWACSSKDIMCVLSIGIPTVNWVDSIWQASQCNLLHCRTSLIQLHIYTCTKWHVLVALSNPQLTKCTYTSIVHRPSRITYVQIQPWTYIYKSDLAAFQIHLYIEYQVILISIAPKQFKSLWRI